MTQRTASLSSTAVPRSQSTSERLAVAQSLLLTPFGLDDTHLAKALAEIKAHRVDDADLYFQYTRSEGWSLEEGIVKTGSFSIDQGVGVRAVSGEKTAFAYSDDISEASLLDAARTVRSIGAGVGTGRVKVGQQPDCPEPLAVRRAGPDRHARQHRQGGAARQGGNPGPRQRTPGWPRSWPAWPVNTTW